MNTGNQDIWLRELITRISGNSAVGIGSDVDLHEAVGLDSLGRLEILAEIEDEFDIFFEDADLVSAPTIANILALIARKIDDTAGAGG